MPNCTATRLSASLAQPLLGSHCEAVPMSSRVTPAMLSRPRAARSSPASTTSGSTSNDHPAHAPHRVEPVLHVPGVAVGQKLHPLASPHLAPCPPPAPL